MQLIAKIKQRSEAMTSMLVLAALTHLAQDSPNVDGTRWKTRSVGIPDGPVVKGVFKKTCIKPQPFILTPSYLYLLHLFHHPHCKSTTPFMMHTS